MLAAFVTYCRFFFRSKSKMLNFHLHYSNLHELNYLKNKQHSHRTHRKSIAVKACKFVHSEVFLYKYDRISSNYLHISSRLKLVRAENKAIGRTNDKCKIQTEKQKYEWKNGENAQICKLSNLMKKQIIRKWYMKTYIFKLSDKQPSPKTSIIDTFWRKKEAKNADQKFFAVESDQNVYKKLQEIRKTRANPKNYHSF